MTYCENCININNLFKGKISRCQHHILEANQNIKNVKIMYDDQYSFTSRGIMIDDVIYGKNELMN